MKITIWKKDDFFQFTNTGRIDMDAEAVVLPTEPAPLYTTFDYQKPPIGKVENVRLEDGEIVGDLTWFEHSHITDDIWESDLSKYSRFGGFYMKLDPDTLDYSEIDRITSAELKSVSIVPRLNIPGGK